MGQIVFIYNITRRQNNDARMGDESKRESGDEMVREVSISMGSEFEQTRRVIESVCSPGGHKEPDMT